MTLDTTTNDSTVEVNSASTLNSDLTISAGTGLIQLDGTIDGNNDLILNTTAGITDINGVIGGTAPIATLTTDAGVGATQIGANISAQGGTLTFNGPVLLDTGPITLTDTGGTGVMFNDTVDGAQDLTLAVTGATTPRSRSSMTPARRSR